MYSVITTTVNLDCIRNKTINSLLEYSQTMPEHRADLQRLCGDMSTPFTEGFIKRT